MNLLRQQICLIDAMDYQTLIKQELMALTQNQQKRAVILYPFRFI